MKQTKIVRRTAAALTCLLLMISGFVPLYAARAESAEIQTGQTGTITAECTATMPEELSGKEYRITDGLVESYQQFKPGQTLLVDLAAGASGLYLEWYTLTSQYTLTQLDSSGATLSEDAPQPYLNTFFSLKEGAAKVSINFTGKCALSTLAVYGAEIPSSVQRWNAPSGSDLVIIASSPKTALDDFFGVITTYACNNDIPTSLVVMSTGSRSAQGELLSALWYVGYDQYPYFGDFQSENPLSYKVTKGEWGKKPPLVFIQDYLETLAPKVLVTHASDETALDGSAQYTGECAVRAAKGAGIQKVYLASASGGTKLDYTTPLNGCGGKSVTQLASEVFAFCTSRFAYETALNPSAVFLLHSSEVGEDSSANQLLEHIDTATLGAFVEPTPTPMPTPEPTPEPTQEPEATQAGTDEAPSAQTDMQQTAPSSIATMLFSQMVRIGILAVCGLISIILLLTYGLKKRRRRIRPGAVVVSLLPVLVGVLAFGALAYMSKLQPVVAPVETPAPRETVQPEATEEPAPKPSAEPEAQAEPAEAEELAASASDEFYRKEGEPAEVVAVDEENGHWEYRTDTLSIMINRVTTEYTSYSGKVYPLVYFVAHIRMREINAFRTVQAADNRNGAGAIKPWIIARRNKAVLMITGDNLTESDTQYKSILIRDGKVFLDSAKNDFMAMYPDMTMKIFSPKETNATELLMDGVREAFSFAPTFIRDGVFTTDDIDHFPRIGNETNPRTGLGIVEPGHFVAIVADGRQKEYSFGMRLSDFGQLFVKEGCVQAYNLDGGVSACMLFMGEQLNHHGSNRVGTIEDTYQRRIPDGLVWGFSDAVPSEDDPIYHRGEG